MGRKPVRDKGLWLSEAKAPGPSSPFLPSPPASDLPVFRSLPQFPQPWGGAVPLKGGRRGSRGRGSGVHTPQPSSPLGWGEPARPRWKDGEKAGAEAWGSGRRGGPGCRLFSPRPLYRLPHSSAPPYTFARAFHVLPPPPARTVHALPPRSELRGTPPQPHDPECTLLSPGPVPRAVFFIPYFPHPPGACSAPHTRAGPGQRAGAGVHGARARGRLRVGVRGEGRGRLVPCVPGPARAAAASARTRGGGRGEGIKGAGSPLPDPPFFTSTPTRLKGRTALPPLWPGLFVRQSGNTFHTPLFLAPPPLCLQAPRPVCACVPSAAQRPAYSGPPPNPGCPWRYPLRVLARPACAASRSARAHPFSRLPALSPAPRGGASPVQLCRALQWVHQRHLSGAQPTCG